MRRATAHARLASQEPMASSSTGGSPLSAGAAIAPAFGRAVTKPVMAPRRLLVPALRGDVNDMTVTKLAFVALTVLCLLGAPAQAHDVQTAAPAQDDPCPPVQVNAAGPTVHIAPECLDDQAANAGRQI